jgi:hypothetical protein
MKNKSYVISASFDTGCYRHIKISANAYLNELHTAILDAFGFEDDHAHAFFMNNKAWDDSEGYFVEYLEDEKRYTNKFKLSDVGLVAGKRFLYIFDFGEEYRFNCKVLKELVEDTENAVVIKSVGEPMPLFGDPDSEEPEAEAADSDDFFPEVYDDKKLMKLYKVLPIPQETIELLKAYFNAFANLYGIIPLEKAFEIFNKQNEPISEKAFAAFSEVVRHEKHSYHIMGADDLYSDVKKASLPMEREIIQDSLLMYEDDYDKMKAAHRGKQYYIPSKRTLLKYADSCYFEKNQEFNALRDFLIYKMKLPVEKGEDLADELNLIASMAKDDIQEVFNTVDFFGAVFASTEQAKEFMRLYMEMSNNTRMQINRGHTPSELGSKREKLPPRQIAFGPNIKKLIKSGEMSLVKLRRDAEKMDFPNEALRASYFSEIDRIEREIREECRTNHRH